MAALKAFHESHGKLATITAVRPPGRFGTLTIAPDQLITTFQEKPVSEGGWINGGFAVLSPKTLDYVDDDAMAWERKPLETLAKDGQLKAFFHEGFWQPMDTMRDKIYLEEQWRTGKAKWKLWA